jgi:threonine dehydrogenase-like Zn-dependent dehydrogenase
VYIAGAGPVGLCAAAASFLLGAGRVIVADVLPDRLKQAELIGCKSQMTRMRPAVAEEASDCHRRTQCSLFVWL